jgi:hypothetical protein
MPTIKNTVQTTATPSPAIAPPQFLPPSPPAPAAAPVTPITGTAADSAHANKVDLQMAYQTLSAGLIANYQAGDVFRLKAGTLTRDELVTLFQGFLASAEKTKAAHQAWKAAVQDEHDVLAQVRPLRAGLHVYFQSLYGKDGAELRIYGFEPQKPRVMTVKAKAEGQARAKATRAARGTKGKRQREAITAEPAAPPAVPASPASPPSPAPASPAPQKQ